VSRLSTALRLVAGLAVLLAIRASPLPACSVPVFRFALERWPADDYEAVLFHRGRLAQADQAVVDWIRENAAGRVNLRVEAVDLNGQVSEKRRDLWQTQREAGLPCLVVRYPRGLGRDDVVWTGRLTPAAAGALLDSPARREIVRRILNGDSAVWVLLEGEDEARNDAAAGLLEAELKKMERTLELPSLGDAAGPRTADTDVGPELRIGFSLVRVPREDPKEQMLVQMLLCSEDDLGTYQGPMAFPIFGRGRALYALVDKGITPENIKEACAFLVGACSCLAKAENPGTDLVMVADWENSLRERVVKDVELPPLVGFSEFEKPEVRQPVPVGRARVEPRRSRGLVRNVIIAVILGLSAAAVGTLVVTRGNKRAA